MAGSGTTEPPAGEEVWRVGQAADYLNAGGVDLRITGRKVRRWARDPRRLIRATSQGFNSWSWVSAESVRAERIRLLSQLGRRDPALDADGEQARGDRGDDEEGARVA